MYMIGCVISVEIYCHNPQGERLLTGPRFNTT